MAEQREDLPALPDLALLAGLAGPARPGGRRAGRGDVRCALLSLLADGPANGYGMMQAIAARTDGGWKPSSGSVYPTLQQLVDEGLISPTGTGRSTEYALTAAGRGYVGTHAEELVEAWRGSPRLSDEDRELFRSMGRLMSATLQLRFASAEQRAAGIRRLDETRREMFRILAD